MPLRFALLVVIKAPCHVRLYIGEKRDSLFHITRQRCVGKHLQKQCIHRIGSVNVVHVCSQGISHVINSFDQLVLFKVVSRLQKSAHCLPLVLEGRFCIQIQLLLLSLRNLDLLKRLLGVGNRAARVALVGVGNLNDLRRILEWRFKAIGNQMHVDAASIVGTGRV